MSPSKILSSSRLAMLGIVLVLSGCVMGCAVLTVDVDVYKGPLSNETDVQTKQLAAITMAAKPILISLTNTLAQLHTNDNQSHESLGNMVVAILDLYEDLHTNQVVMADAAAANAIKSLNEMIELPRREPKSGEPVGAGKGTTNEVDASGSQPRKSPAEKEAILDEALRNTEAITSVLTTMGDDSRYMFASGEASNTLVAVRGVADTIAKGDLPSVEQLESVKIRLWSIRDSIRSSLTGGRLTDGLETIISRYLDYDASFPDRHTGLDRADSADNKTNSVGYLRAKYRNQLKIATVDFAAKVKFIADNMQLSHGDVQVLRRARRCVQALEAIGNSILSLDDALQERFKFSVENDWSSNRVARGNAGVRVANQYLTNLLGATNVPANTTPLSSLNSEQDVIIETLKHIQVISTLAGDDNLAKRAQAAIDLATAYRSDHIFIMPAMAYLRSSYPATSLQKNDDGLWRNMLSRQGWHSLPAPFGELAANGLSMWSEDSDARNQAQIDKQFWQTINQIRVAGSGITSYVITKDDIGNWYVKSYTADPSPIIEGAKGLALNSVAPAANVRAAVSSPKVPATNAQPDLLFRQLTIASNKWSSQTLRDATNILRFSEYVLSDVRSRLGISVDLYTNAFQTNITLASDVRQSKSGTNVQPVIYFRQMEIQLPRSNSLSIMPATVTNSISGLWSNEVGVTIAFVPPDGLGPVVNAKLVATTNVAFHASSFVTNEFTNKFEISVPPASQINTNIEMIHTNIVAGMFTNAAPSYVLGSTNGTGLGSFSAAAGAWVTNLVIGCFTNVDIRTNVYVLGCTNSSTNSESLTVETSWTVALLAHRTNWFALTVTNELYLSNAASAVAGAETNIAFLESGYNRLITNSVATLRLLLAHNPATNVAAVAQQELDVLKQWDELVNQAAISAPAEQRKTILKYVAPPLRELVKKRMEALKPYEIELMLLSASQE